MALFRRGDSSGSGASGASASPEAHSILGKQAFCRVCNRDMQMTKCWLRTKPVSVCGCCGNSLPNAADLYKKRQPACPKCGEWLEQPGFEYGVCDGCGSKFEITEGCRPCLIPNQQQRRDMDNVGRAWSRD